MLNRKNNIIKQINRPIAIFEIIFILLSAVSLFLYNMGHYINERFESGQKIAKNTAVILESYQSLDFLIAYWQEHFDEMEFFYDDTETFMQKEQALMQKIPEMCELEYITSEEAEHFTPEEQKLFAELCYFQLSQNFDRTKRTYKPLYLYSFVMQEEKMFFLVTGSNEGELRISAGGNNLYELGCTRYQTTKLPVHLIRELEIITDILKDIHDRLNHSIERAYIISDHGVSRLSVIYENECQWKMASKGEHSGRCCPVNEADVRSEYAAKENNFWVLANYDRFKGGRQMGVEVHGGASLEEVVVPIIELTAVPEKIEIQIVENPITVSYRKKAEIKLFTKTKLCHVTVHVNEKEYDAEPQGNFYLVEMPDIRKAGTYQMTVFSNQNQVAELKFTVKKESSSEKSIL